MLERRAGASEKALGGSALVRGGPVMGLTAVGRANIQAQR